MYVGKIIFSPAVCFMIRRRGRAQNEIKKYIHIISPLSLINLQGGSSRSSVLSNPSCTQQQRSGKRSKSEHKRFFFYKEKNSSPRKTYIFSGSFSFPFLTTRLRFMNPHSGQNFMQALYQQRKIVKKIHTKPASQFMQT